MRRSLMSSRPAPRVVFAIPLLLIVYLSALALRPSILNTNRIDARRIRLRRHSPSAPSYRGIPSSEVVQALNDLGFGDLAARPP
jgi:hypothetical protein